MMAFLTYFLSGYCSSSHRHHQSNHSHYQHVKQIVFLIITFVVYVSGIRNTATVGGSSEFNANFQQQQYQSSHFEPTMPSNYEFQRPITPPPPAASPSTTFQQTYAIENEAKVLQQKEFRPSEQIYEFTLSDATPVTPNYPPSYLSTNYNDITNVAAAEASNNINNNHFQNRQTEIANKRYHKEENTQFAFPSETFNNIFGNAPTTTPPQLQTTPILTYKDPYSNEKFEASPASATTALGLKFKDNIANADADADDANLIYYGNQQYQGDIAAQQAYTVQSSLLVGNGQSHANRVDSSYRPLSSPNNEYKRPGYVFDEQIRPNYISSSSSSGSSNGNKFKQQQTTFSNRKPMPPQRLSYDSHDYPPPSYYQRPAYLQQHQQQSTYFQSPQRQDIGHQPISQASTQTASYQPAMPTSASASSSSSTSNYANNFGNYLLTDAQQQYQYQQQPQQQQQQHFPPHTQQYALAGNYNPNQQRPPTLTAQRPPSNYYEYQLGEIPPQRRPPPPHSYPNYGPQRPPQAPPQPPQTNGLASLASLFTTTQQYAPQFTNLLIGALTGGGGGGGGGASSSLRPQQQRPPNMQLIKALENIARNDDLQCVPKVLCQTIAGQTQRGQLPSFITSPAITNFLAGFPAASPALIYGRAALLGISGGERSCAQTYEKCPKNEYEILYYLNNHRGGFFKFFSEPEEQATAASTSSNGNYDDNSIGGSGGGGSGGGVSSSLFSILTALTGNPAPKPPTTTTTTTTQRPATTLDVAGGIGNFFTQVLSDYLSGVEYQRRRRRRRSVKTEIKVDTIEPETDVEKTKILNNEDFHDEEDNEDTEDNNEDEEQYADVEARIVHNHDEIPGDYPKFFPVNESEEKRLTTSNINDEIQLFNAQKAVRKLKFPSAQVDDRDPGKLGVSWVSFEDTTTANGDQHFGASNLKSKRRGKKFNAEHATQGQRIIFPDHYEQHIRKARILNRPSYAASYGDYVRATANDEDRFVIANNHRRPHNQDYEQTTSSLNGQYYTQTSAHYATSLSSSSSSSLNGSHGNRYSSPKNGFRPTPLPSSPSNAQRYTHSNGNGYQGLHGGSTGSSSTYSGSNAASSYTQFSSQSGNYNYPNNNYVSNNRYSSNYQRPMRTTTTQRPRHEDDKNIYVTNGNGINEYYITPDGRKIYY